MDLIVSLVCFDEGERKYNTVNSYGAHWVKNIKDNVMSYQTANKRCIWLSLLIILQMALRSSARLLVFLWGLIQLFFFQLNLRVLLK